MRAWWFLILVACSNGADGATPGVDTTVDDTEMSTDGSVADVDGGGQDVDVEPTDVPTVADVPTDVPPIPDLPPPLDVPSSTCGELSVAYNAEAAALNECTQGSDCEWVTHPVCGSGCAVAVNATADHTALEAAWQAFSTAGCVPDPIVPECCDLAPPMWGFGCAAGKCQPCNYKCALDCTCKKDASGCDLPECENTGCSALTQAVEDAVSANDGCATNGDCMRFEHPICGTIGCYQRAVSQNAPLAQLSTLAQAAQDAGCEPFHCGCGPEGEPLCVNGSCALCPGSPGCPTTCEELRAAIHEVAATGSACTSSTDCTMLFTPFCDAGKGLGCYALAVSGYVAVNAATGLLKQFNDLKCGGDDCDCFGAEVPICKDGACLPFYYVQ